MIQALTSPASGYTGLPLLSLCDATGATIGFVAALYNGAADQVTVFKFDANLQPVTVLVTSITDFNHLGNGTA